MKQQELTHENLFKGRLLTTKKERQHYTDLVSKGLLFPTTIQQVRYMIKRNARFGKLGLGDVEDIEKVFNRYGMSGDYAYVEKKHYAILSLFSMARLLKLMETEME